MLFEYCFVGISSLKNVVGVCSGMSEVQIFMTFAFDILPPRK
jgi:hypothetical protein